MLAISDHNNVHVTWACYMDPDIKPNPNDT